MGLLSWSSATTEDCQMSTTEEIDHRTYADNSTGWFVGTIVALALLAIAYLVFSANAQPAYTASNQGDYAQAAVMVDLGNDSHGSGVYIGNGFVLTAGHVTDDKKTVKVRTQVGQVVDGRVLWGSLYRLGGHDVGLVYVEGLQVPAAELTCTNPVVGDDVSIIGNPYEVEFARTWGKVSATGLTGLETDVAMAWSELYTLDVTAAPGVSGGPVFNDRGQIVGILVGGMVGTPRGNFNYSYMVPASAVCRMLGRT
jgi:S1-C subfamily serine protease